MANIDNGVVSLVNTVIDDPVRDAHARHRPVSGYPTAPAGSQACIATRIELAAPVASVS